MRKLPKPIAILKSAFDKFIDDDGMALAGHLAFVALLSLIPFLLFVVTLAGFFGATESGTYFFTFLQENMPDEVAKVFEPALIEVFQSRRGGLLTVSLIAVVWMAGSGIEGVRVALNRAYGAGEHRPYWRRRLQGLALVVLYSGFFLAAAAALFFGPILWSTIRDALGLGPEAAKIWTMARYMIGGLTLFTIACTLYYLLPDQRPGWRGVIPGAVASLALSLGASILFSLYLAHFDRYAVIYGSLGGVIAALIYFYVLSAIFVYGAEINAATERARNRDDFRDPSD